MGPPPHESTNAKIKLSITFQSMAASKAQKEQAARMLAANKTESETAATVGIGRSTLQGWKRKTDFQSKIKSYRAAVHIAETEITQKSGVRDSLILEGVAALQINEADIASRLWNLFEKLEEKTLGLLEASAVEDMSPRQIPALTKACTDVVQAGITLNDRIAGIGALLDGYQRIEKARAQGSEQ